MTYVVLKLGQTQIIAQKGDIIKLDRQAKMPKPEVLLFSDGKNTRMGFPFLLDITVKLSKVEDALDDKIRVGRFKSKSRYNKLKGHRQPITLIKVEDILEKGTEKSGEEKEVKTPVKEIAVKQKKSETVKVKKEVKLKKVVKK